MHTAEMVHLLSASVLGLLCIVATAAPITGNLPISTNGQCQTNGAICGLGNCCSQYGWCGSTSGYCGSGCQPDWGECWSSATSASSSPTSTAPATTSSSPPTTSTPTTRQPSTSSSTPPTTFPTSGADAIRVIRSCVVPDTVAITFDDGPYVYTSQIAQQFAKVGGHVTFFMNGLNWACVYDHAEAVKAAFDAGHQIGSHTWSHADLTILSAAVVTTQMNQLSTAFRKILGAVPVYMRPPYGLYNDAVLGLLKSLGFKMLTMWDVDPGDTLGATTAQQGLAYDSSPANASHIVVQHETSQNTVQNVVPLIIDWAQRRNLRMVTVGECLGDAAVNWYKDYATAETRNPSWAC